MRVAPETYHSLPLRDLNNQRDKIIIKLIIQKPQVESLIKANHQKLQPKLIRKLLKRLRFENLNQLKKEVILQVQQDCKTYVQKIKPK